MGGVGIVIVTFNSAGELGACLDAACRTGADVVVVDNASTDGTRGEVARRGVRLLANPVNRGFAAAVNQGIRALASPFILLLNPDAVIEGGIEALVEVCARPGAAGAGGMLVDDGGLPQAGFMVRRLPRPRDLAFEALLVNRLWPRNPANWQYRCLGLDACALQEVEQPAGAFLMIRREVWEELRGFDEGFRPLWFEDVDFCRRARARGYRFYYVPEAVAKHTGGHSVAGIGVEKRVLYWYGSLLRYAAVHYGPGARRCVCLAVAAGSIARLIGDLAARRGFETARVYARVIAMAFRYLFRGAPA